LTLRAAKYILIFTLTIGIALPDVVLHQVLRIPVLAAHYYHHITEHESIGAIAFIELHYGNTRHMQTDAHEHENLPGNKKNQDFQHTQIIPVVLPALGLRIIHPDFNAKAEHFATVREHIPSNNATPIWQPPKVA
jgi:hypothetical protein